MLADMEPPPTAAPAVGWTRAFARELPQALSCAALEPASADQLAPLIRVTRHVSRWVHLVGRLVVLDLPSRAEDKELRRELAADQPEPAGTAARAAAGVWASGEAGGRLCSGREGLRRTASDLDELGRRVPASAAGLSELAGKLRDELRQWDGRSGAGAVSPRSPPSSAPFPSPAR